MNECKIYGCRLLQTVCITCGRVVCTKTFPLVQEWISVKDQRLSPFQDVLLCADGKIVIGWDEACQPEEDPAYCSFQEFDPDKVTHFMHLPKPPREDG